MADALPIRSTNPVLSSDTFRGARVRTGEEVMTIQGTVNKSLLAFAILLAAAGYAWNLGPTNPSLSMLMMVGVLGGLGAAIATSVRPTWAPISVPIYAALEGLALGGISVVIEQRFPGIVSQAVFLTFGTLGAMLLGYRSGLLRATPAVQRVIMTATMGIALVYLINLVMSFFGSSLPLIHSSGPIGIGFSLIVVGVAAFNLVLDFDLIERGAERGAPQYMEWYGAFALLVTLVWLYLEILRLLQKLQEQRR